MEDTNSEWRTADLLSARRITKPEDDDVTYIYYCYDLALAPKVCDSTVSKTSENLGLGFCPYDRIGRQKFLILFLLFFLHPIPFSSLLFLIGGKITLLSCFGSALLTKALISAVLLNQYLYVFQLECTKDEWKCCNSDLKRIRDSFRVSALVTKPRQTNI